METAILFVQYILIAITVLVVFTYALCFISAFFKVYVVFHTYLDDRKIVINKDLEHRIIKELNVKFPYQKALTIKLEVINDIESKILWTIKKEYEEEIDDNIIDYKK